MVVRKRVVFIFIYVLLFVGINVYIFLSNGILIRKDYDYSDTIKTCIEKKIFMDSMDTNNPELKIWRTKRIYCNRLNYFELCIGKTIKEDNCFDLNIKSELKNGDEDFYYSINGVVCFPVSKGYYKSKVDEAEDSLIIEILDAPYYLRDTNKTKFRFKYPL